MILLTVYCGGLYISYQIGECTPLCLLLAGEGKNMASLKLMVDLREGYWRSDGAICLGGSDRVISRDSSLDRRDFGVCFSKRQELDRSDGIKCDGKREWWWV